MITSVAYTSTGSSIIITTADGIDWFDDASLPADTDLRRQLADWLAAGNTITAYTMPEPTLEDQLAAIEADFDRKKTALIEQLGTATLIRGSTVPLENAYTQICNEKADAIAALLLGV